MEEFEHWGFGKINNKELTNRRGKFIYIVDYGSYELLPKHIPNIYHWGRRGRLGQITVLQLNLNAQNIGQKTELSDVGI